MGAFGRLLVIACAPLLSCASKHAGTNAGGQPAASPPDAGAADAEAEAQAAAPSPEAKGTFAEWLRARLPAGGKVVVDGAGSCAVEHTVSADDTAQTIANAYIDLTDVYRARDLAADIARRNPELPPGAVVVIPHLVSAPYKSPDEERLPWTPDLAMKGVFISGAFAGAFWPETIEKLAARGLNAVVLDAKDYMGPINYPTKVKLALEMGAAKDPPIPDYFRAIRFAHARGVHVIARIPCFHDPWAAAHARRLSLMGSSGRPFQMGWMDPMNTEAQDYLVDLVKEAVDLGADEVQLDYVRFPVQSRGIKDAVMPAPDGHRSQAMKAFVKRIHDVTRAAHVALSLDLFGVTATGDPSDIEALGQNIAVLGSEAEALSPMVYPSHYAKGFNGFDEPGNHAEIIGMGTKGALEKLRRGKITGAVIRPWLQASAYKTPVYGPKYIADEIKSAETSGAVGWLMWDPQNSYWAVWRALPVIAGR